MEIEVEMSELDYYDKNETYCDFYTCPNCSSDDIVRIFKYCPKCGAKIIWTDKIGGN